jgi:hypothetical protein
MNHHGRSSVPYDRCRNGRETKDIFDTRSLNSQHNKTQPLDELNSSHSMPESEARKQLSDQTRHGDRLKKVENHCFSGRNTARCFGKFAQRETGSLIAQYGPSRSVERHASRSARWSYCPN